MTIYLAAAIPNVWFPSWKNQLTMISIGLSTNQVADLICDYNSYASYSDNIAPLMLKGEVISCVSHRNMGDKISHELWEYAPAYDDYGDELKPVIPLSKKEITPQKGDTVIALLNVVNTGSRIAKRGEFVPPTKWIKCTFE